MHSAPFDDPELPVVRAVRRALAAKRAAPELGRAVLEAVGDSLGWLVGLIWLIDEPGKELYPLTSWRARVHERQHFERISLALTFRRGEGYPGAVWEQNSVVWSYDVLTNPHFRRPDVAKAEGLHAALALPLRAHGEVVGVMEFFTDQLLAPVEALREVFVLLGEETGARLARVGGDDSAPLARPAVVRAAP